MKKLLLSSLLCFFSLGRAFSLHDFGNTYTNDVMIRGLKTKVLLVSSNFEKAEVSKELGILYQKAARSDTKLLHAVDAFQQAIELYQNEDATTTKNLDNILADLYFRLGETYDEIWWATSDDKYIPPMLEAGEQSKRLYRTVGLQHNEDPLTAFRYAMVFVRQGRVRLLCEKDPVQAWDLFQEGLVQHLEPVWEKLQSMTENEEDLKRMQDQRRIAWFQAYQAAAELRRYEDGLQALRPVMEYYENADPSILAKEDSSSYYNYAQALSSQGDLYFHLKLYKLAEQSYQKSMVRYRQQPPHEKEEIPSSREEIDATDRKMYQESIRKYQAELQEYMMSCHDIDYGHVGYLHASLGPFYTAIKEWDQAEVHLREAIRCYISAEENDRKYLADIHVNLSVVLYHKQEYAESAEQMVLACQLFQRQVEGGDNLMFSLEMFAVDEL